MHWELTQCYKSIILPTKKLIEKEIRFGVTRGRGWWEGELHDGGQMVQTWTPRQDENLWGENIKFNANGKNKYINTRETVIFKKRENLYNYHLAAPNARKEKSIIICEGFMDAIRIYSIGVKNVVATMGTALAKEQIELLKKLGVKVIVVMDNDNAGLMATKSIGKELIDNGIDTGIVRLTGIKDPDEYILEYGKNAFIDNIKNWGIIY